MRTVIVALLLVGLSGCLSSDSGDGANLGSGHECTGSRESILYLGEGLSLGPELPAAGRTPGNGFDEAFLTNDLDEWRSENAKQDWLIEGDVTLEFWTQGNAMPAPIVIGGDPGEGYHFFNQFGTTAGFVESYAIEYETAVGDTELRKFTETFTMPVGGMVWEGGRPLRLLLTNLVLDEPVEGRGPDILWGGDTPSHLRFELTCIETSWYEAPTIQEADISIPAHRGLLTGAVPATEGLNQQTVPFTLQSETDRLSILIVTSGSDTLPKSDIDLTILDSAGAQSWSIGSPYTNEVGTRWRANLDAVMPPGEYAVRVDSYSGHAYEGTLAILQQVAS